MNEFNIKTKKINQVQLNFKIISKFFLSLKNNTYKLLKTNISNNNAIYKIKLIRNKWESITGVKRWKLKKQTFKIF